MKIMIFGLVLIVLYLLFHAFVLRLHAKFQIFEDEFVVKFYAFTAMILSFFLICLFISLLK